MIGPRGIKSEQEHVKVGRLEGGDPASGHGRRPFFAHQESLPSKKVEEGGDSDDSCQEEEQVERLDTLGHAGRMPFLLVLSRA